MLPVAIVLWPIAAFDVKACAIQTIASRSAKKWIFGARSRVILFPPVVPAERAAGAMSARVQMGCQNVTADRGAERSVNIGNPGDFEGIGGKVCCGARWRRPLSEKRDFFAMIIRMFSRCLPCGRLGSATRSRYRDAEVSL